tara:strand:- start:334 stop:1800 length:1467 start_codon:yes stop_codon:yes gene_type:complete
LLLFLKFFLCGVFTSLLFPPFFLIPLGFIIFPYLIYLLDTNKNCLNYPLHFFAGFLFGLGFFSIFLLWLREPFFLVEKTKNYALFSYLLVIYCSLYFGFIFCFIKLFNKVILKLFMFPALIIISEFICGNFLYGFPWFSFALVNSNNIFGTTLVFYFGSLGLSYITILIFLLPYIFLLENKKTIKLLFLNYVILIASILFLVFFKILNNDNDESNLLSITIAQLNYPVNQHLSLEEKNIKLKRVTEIISNSNSEIIIFAENDFPFLMNEDRITFLQKNLQVNQKLIIGSVRKESLKYYNSLFLISKNNYQKFDKKILVPFGEFIPFRNFFNFMEYIAGNIDFSVGSDDRFINLEENFNILPVICYEIIYFSNLIKKNNTNIIINLTNDSWFGKLFGPYQHFYFTKLRSAEFNKPAIRVSSNGISGLIDKNGNVKNFIKLNKSDIKKFDIIKTDIKNNYLQFHKFFFLIIILSFLLGLILNKLNEKRAI